MNSVGSLSRNVGRYENLGGISNLFWRRKFWFYNLHILYFSQKLGGGMRSPPWFQRHCIVLNHDRCNKKKSNREVWLRTLQTYFAFFPYSFEHFSLLSTFFCFHHRSYLRIDSSIQKSKNRDISSCVVLLLLIIRYFMIH